MAKKSSLEEVKPEITSIKPEIPLEIVQQIFILAEVANKAAGMQRISEKGPRIALIAANVIEFFEPHLPKPEAPAVDQKAN